MDSAATGNPLLVGRAHRIDRPHDSPARWRPARRSSTGEQAWKPPMAVAVGDARLPTRTTPWMTHTFMSAVVGTVVTMPSLQCWVVEAWSRSIAAAAASSALLIVSRRRSPLLPAAAACSALVACRDRLRAGHYPSSPHISACNASQQLVWWHMSWSMARGFRCQMCVEGILEP